MASWQRLRPDVRATCVQASTTVRQDDRRDRGRSGLANVSAQGVDDVDASPRDLFDGWTSGGESVIFTQAKIASVGMAQLFVETT